MMKGMKGRFLRKLKSISTITALRQVSVFQVNPSNQNFHTSSAVDKEKADETNNPKELFPGNISIVPKALDQVEDEETDSAFHECERENFGGPPIESEDAAVPAKDHPDIPIALESGSMNARTVLLPAVQLLKESDQTFDFPPYPLLKIEMVMEHNSSKEAEENEEIPTVLNFEEKCPPGGREAVILYATSLTGIRKTFEDCSSIRFLLESFRVLYHERDVSMHLEFREELWRILGGRVVPPRLFIRGRHIGGADEVIGLHEQGKLRNLFHGIPLNSSNTPCSGCGGMRFVVCFKCNGSQKIIPDEPTNELSTRCGDCNENGLIKCPICCC